MAKISGLSYQDAGVNIDTGNQLVESIKPFANATKRPEVLAGIGGFGGLFALQHYQNPILVSGTDGVGTKLKLANMMRKHDTIGIDLVAMCVNDVIVTGAEPLFFLDYYATGKLNLEIATTVIKSIAAGCGEAGCTLIGGETAEMPGMYQAEDYDLAGFCVGVVEKDQIIDGTNIQVNDVLIALASSGPHSNGYSLIRKIIDSQQISLDTNFDQRSLGEILLTPTKIYVKTILKLRENYSIKGIAHITGGGLIENIPRILPPTIQAEINTHSWQWPKIFQWLQKTGNIATQEMYRTFNCGVGMIIVVAQEDAKSILDFLKNLNEPAWQIGKIKPRPAGEAGLALCP